MYAFKNYDEFKNGFAYYFNFSESELDGDKDMPLRVFWERYAKDKEIILCDPANEVCAVADRNTSYDLVFEADGNGDVLKWEICKITTMPDLSHQSKTLHCWQKITFIEHH